MREREKFMHRNRERERSGSTKKGTQHNINRDNVSFITKRKWVKKEE